MSIVFSRGLKRRKNVMINPYYYQPAPVTPEFPLLPGTSALAISFRKLIDEYTGDCVRLVRDSDDAELDFGFDPTTFLLDWAAINTWLGGSDGFIKRWYSQDAPASVPTDFKDLYQPTKSKMALLDTTAKEAIFDGVNTWYKTKTREPGITGSDLLLFNFPATKQSSIYIVHTIIGSGTQIIFELGPNFNPAGVASYTDAAKLNIGIAEAINQYNVKELDPTPIGKHLLTVQVDKDEALSIDEIYGFINGIGTGWVQTSTATMSTFVTSGEALRIGARVDNSDVATFPVEGSIQEIIWKPILDDSVAQSAMEADIMGFYSL